MKFEYRILDASYVRGVEKEIKKLGMEGWEMFQIIPPFDYDNGHAGPSTVKEYQLFFKRSIPAYEE